MDRLKAWNCESYAILARQKFNVSLYDLFFSRLQTPTRARAWAIIKMREERGYSYPELGKLWARDHTTIMALYRKWKNGPQKKDG